MTNLCHQCQKNKPDTTMRGSCQAPNYVAQSNLPSDHIPWTESFEFSLCEFCSEHFGQCSWCRGALYGESLEMVPSKKRFCLQENSDNGSHVEGMNVGEQILVKLTIDLYSGLSWGPKSLSNGVQLDCMRLVTDGGQYGFLEMYFDLTLVDPLAKIELQQFASRNWVNLQNPQTWSITVDVQH